MASSPRIEELRKKFEENPRRYFAPLANEYRKAGDIEQAIAICREYLPQQPGHMSGHIVYGQALYEARQVDEAKSVFETALSLDPENLIALRHLGDIALLVGDSPGARLWYGRVLEADPRNEEIQAQLARLDQTDSTPTPVVSPQVESGEPAASAESSRPTPSSAPTVVVSAMRVPPAAKDEPVDKSRATVPTPSSTIDAAVTLERPAVPPPEIEKSAHDPIGLEPTSMAAPESFGTQETVPLDISIVEQVARSKEAPPIDSFSLEGLETTSMAPPESVPAPPEPPAPAAAAAAAAAATPSPAPEEPVEVPNLELADVAVEEAAPGPPAGAAPEPAQAAAPTDDLPLLDIGELPVASAAPAPSVPAPPPETPTPPVAAPEPAFEPIAGPVAEHSLDTSAPESGPFVTETMAELYLHQGHHEEALRVYRALLEQRPGDARLQAKIDALSVSSPEVPAPTTPAPQPSARAFEPVPRAGRSIRDLLTSIAVRRPSGSAIAPVQNGGAQPQTDFSETSPPAAQEQKPRPDDRLASLFGVVDTLPGDESAAMVLSQAFMELNGLEHGRGEMSGEPAHPANSELSLDAVFKGDGGKSPAPSTFSFDQFFSQRATTEHPTSVPSGTSEGATRDDATQFTQWLEGLKQR